MNKKLIVTDLDDTLLRRDKSVSEYTKHVFNRCRNSGILIAFATMRSEQMSERFTQQIAPDILISSGGALAKRGPEILYKSTIPPGFAHGIIKKCADLGIAQIAIDSADGFFDSCPAELLDTEYGDVYKIAAYTEDRQLSKLISAEFPSIEAIGFKDEDRWHVFRARSATKELAMKAVCVSLEIPLERTVAFGDDLSDIGMLRAAGIGVSMQNAHDEVKAAADYICGDCDDDGAAKWIEDNLL